MTTNSKETTTMTTPSDTYRAHAAFWQTVYERILPTTAPAVPSIASTIIAQIGQGNILAISGGRIDYGPGDTVVLPVRYGYTVEIELDRGSDTYIVRRVFSRGLKRWVKRQWSHVYAEQVGEIAYRASCYLDD